MLGLVILAAAAFDVAPLDPLTRTWAGAGGKDRYRTGSDDELQIPSTASPFLRARSSNVRLCFPPGPGLCHIDLGRTRAVRAAGHGKARKSDQVVDVCRAAIFILMVLCKATGKWLATSAYCGVSR